MKLKYQKYQVITQQLINNVDNNKLDVDTTKQLVKIYNNVKDNKIDTNIKIDISDKDYNYILDHLFNNIMKSAKYKNAMYKIIRKFPQGIDFSELLSELYIRWKDKHYLKPIIMYCYKDFSKNSLLFSYFYRAIYNYCLEINKYRYRQIELRYEYNITDVIDEVIEETNYINELRNYLIKNSKATTIFIDIYILHNFHKYTIKKLSELFGVKSSVITYRRKELNELLNKFIIQKRKDGTIN